jgi:predicted acyltransferase
VALVIAGLFLTMNPRSSDERMLRSLFLWAATWLVIGLVLDPSEGGIKKTPETLSYFFTVTGLTMMLLVALTVITESLAKRRAVSALIDVGHNPLLTYVIYTVLINSLFEMIPPMRAVLRASQGEAMLRSVLELVIVVLLVRLASRRRIYWRT